MSSQLAHPSKHLGVGGLCHLVEAATALSKLVEAPDALKGQVPTQKLSTSSSSAPEKPFISDDDDEKNRCKREIFPQRLIAILSDTSLADIVTWLPNGRSFVIVRPDVFTETVLPKYLPPVDARGSTKYPSFTRKLNRWGFRQITRGPDTGAFHHPLFRRDEPLLCLQMVCQRSRDRRSSNSSKGTTPRAVTPKKRETTQENEALAIAGQAPRQTLSPTLTTACVSSDDNMSSSCSSASTVSASTTSRGRKVALLNVALPASTVCTDRTAVMPRPPSSYVSKDETMIRSALLQSAQNERLRAARAMLYHSYMQALSAKSK